MRYKKDGIVVIMLLAIIFIINLNDYKADAGEKEDLINQMYEVLVIEEKEEFTFHTSTNVTTNEVLELLDEVKAIDKPDFLYDGMVFYLNGHISIYTAGNSFRIITTNKMQQSDMDRVTSEIADIIIKNVGVEATEREKVNYLSYYLSKHFTYSNEQLNATNEGEYQKRIPFTVAYDTKNQSILCDQYALLAYLVGNKIGLKVDFLFTEDHVFNVIEIDGNLVPYDFTSQIVYSGVFMLAFTNDINTAEDIYKDYSLNILSVENFRTYNLIDFAKDYLYYTFRLHLVSHIVVTAALFFSLFIIIRKKKGTERFNSNFARKHRSREEVLR